MYVCVYVCEEVRCDDDVHRGGACKARDPMSTTKIPVMTLHTRSMIANTSAKRVLLRHIWNHTIDVNCKPLANMGLGPFTYCDRNSNNRLAPSGSSNMHHGILMQHKSNTTVNRLIAYSLCGDQYNNIAVVMMITMKMML